MLGKRQSRSRYNFRCYGRLHRVLEESGSLFWYERFLFEPPIVAHRLLGLTLRRYLGRFND